MRPTLPVLLFLFVGFAVPTTWSFNDPLFESAVTRDDDGPIGEPRHVRYRMTPDEVQRAMQGKPDVVLAPDIWGYWHFHSGIAGAQKFDTLLLIFREGRLVQYRLVERRAVTALIDRLQKSPPPSAAR